MPTTTTTYIPRIVRCIIASCVALLVTAATAFATAPPNESLTRGEALRADRALEAAAERGVGVLSASPFLRATACGVAGRVVGLRAARHRALLGALRRVEASGGDPRGVQRSVDAQRAVLRTAVRLRARRCSATAARTVREAGERALRGTTTTQRPAAVATGTGMVIALPVDFADRPADRAGNRPDRYEELFFGDYPHGGGSLAHFYRDMSYGSFSVAGEVAAWSRMPQPRSAYAAGTGGMGAYPDNSQSLLEDAVRLNDRSVDFARFDNDGPDGRPNSGDDDGVVDAVFLIFAGTSSAETGNLDALWPHAWKHAVATRDRSANGGFITVDRYAAVPERMEQEGPDGDLLTVGVVAHEYGHILGLPDLVDGEDAPGAGKWDLMGSGMWGFRSSSRPTGLSAWSRARLGWSVPNLLQGDHPGHQLASASHQRATVKLPIEGKPLHEHFLVERRSRVGFDADLPADGLLVWHVDDAAASDGHPRVELVPADAFANGDGGDMLRPGGALGDSTTPSTRAHDGSPSLVAVQNVAPMPGTAVDLHAGRASLAPVIDASTEAAGPQAAAPTAVLTAPEPGDRLRGTITMSCDAAGSPNINRISFRRGTTTLSSVNVNPSSPTATRTLDWDTTSVANGTYILDCVARNTSNQTTASAPVTVTIDNAAPAAPSVLTPTAGSWVRGIASVTVTGTDNYGVTSFSRRVDGVDSWQGPWAEETPSTRTMTWDTTTASNGNHALSAIARDLAGNVSPVSASVSVGVDNLQPTMPIPADGPTLTDVDVQNSTSTLSARWPAAIDDHSGIAGYTWRFCTTPACGTVIASGTGSSATATGLSLPQGMVYACVRASDLAGNVHERCSDGVLVDSIAPVASAPNDGASAPDIDFQASGSTLTANWAAANDGTGSGVAGYDWRFCPTPACSTVVASGPATGTSATASGLTLADGSTYVACVRARDEATNPSGYLCSDGVTVDLSPPSNTVPLDGVAPPDLQYQSSTSTLAANWPAATDTASDVVGYDWRFCTTTSCTTILASGTGPATDASAGGLALSTGASYVACVRARDAVGRIGAWACSDGVTIDDAGPTMTVVEDSSGPGDIDFQASGTSLAATWAAATDIGSSVSSYDWRFCTTTACSMVLASGSGTALGAAASSLTLSDGASYFACVTAYDTAGNPGAEVCSDGVVADLSAPAVTTPNDGASGPDLSSQASQSDLAVNWAAGSDGAGSGVAGYDWRFCTTTGCSTVLAFGSTAGTGAAATGLTLTDGATYYACVRATDGVGRTSDFVCSDGITVQASPSVMITSPAAGDRVTGTIVVGATATDAGGITKFEYRLDGILRQSLGPLVALSPRTSSWSWDTTTASEGSHTIEVTAYDGSGLTAVDVITVTVDRTAPAASHGGITSGSTITGTVTLTSSSSDTSGIDRVDYLIDGIARVSALAGGATSFTDPGTPFATTSLVDGNHGYRVAVRDMAGNQTMSGPATSFIVNNNVEGTAPTGTVTSPASGQLPATNVSLTASVSDNNVIVKIEWLLDGAPIPGVAADIVPPGYAGGSRTRTWSSTGGVSAGTHTITARVTDASGNTFVTPGVTVTK